MALTRIQYLAPSTTSPKIPGDPSGAKTGPAVEVAPDGSMGLVPTGVASGAYFSADITVGRDGRIIRCNDGQPQINPLTDFEPGTMMIFGNATAPTGWRQRTDTDFNNTMIRLVNNTGGGAGGTADFTQAFGNAYKPEGTLTHNLSIRRQTAYLNILGVNLSIKQTPAHKHTFGFTKVFQYQTGGGAGALNGFGAGFTNTSETLQSFNPQGQHTHFFTGVTSGANIEGLITFNGNSANQFEVTYFDMIVAEST